MEKELTNVDSDIVGSVLLSKNESDKNNDLHKSPLYKYLESRNTEKKSTNVDTDGVKNKFDQNNNSQHNSIKKIFSYSGNSLESLLSTPTKQKHVTFSPDCDFGKEPEKNTYDKYMYDIFSSYSLGIITGMCICYIMFVKSK